MSTIADNIEEVRARIAAAAERARRTPDDITLIGVTKRVGVERMREALQAGVADFGESYFQEAREKLNAFGDEVRWHFIGHLQSNKARYVVGRFGLIHSVDSVDLAREIGRRAVRVGIVQPILLEMKLDPADTKFGLSLDSCASAIDQVTEIAGIEVQGLMGMAPYGSDPEVGRPCFRSLRSAFDQLPPEHRKILSMGMSGDFEVAIEEGATHVRIGTALFGSRI